MHNEGALVKEMDQLVKHELLDLSSPFAMFWDDCDAGMASTFWNTLGPRLKRYAAGKGFAAGAIVLLRINVHGWLGVHERKHGTCLAFNGPAARLLKSAMLLDDSFKRGVEVLKEGSID